MESENDEQNDIENNVILDDNLGSCGSVDEAQTPEDDSESANQSMSSPGGLSALSSLQSPSTSLASPLNLLASPSTPNQMNHNSLDSSQTTNNGHSGGGGGGGSSGLQSFLNINDSSGIFGCKTNTGNGGGNKTNPTNLKTLNNNNCESSNKNSSMNGTTIKIENGPSTSESTNFFNTRTSPTIGLSLDTVVKVEQREPTLVTSSVPTSSSKLFYSNPHMNQFFSSTSHLENFYEKVVRNPVGANPRDINNPLSINQLTKRDYVNHNSPNSMNPASPSSSAVASSVVSALQYIQQTQQQQQQQYITQHHVHHQQQHIPPPPQFHHHHQQSRHHLAAAIAAAAVHHHQPSHHATFPGGSGGLSTNMGLHQSTSIPSSSLGATSTVASGTSSGTSSTSNSTQSHRNQSAVSDGETSAPITVT